MNLLVASSTGRAEMPRHCGRAEAARQEPPSTAPSTIQAMPSPPPGSDGLVDTPSSVAPEPQLARATTGATSHSATSPAATNGAVTPTEPARLYLDLMKRMLTRFGFDDDLTPVAPIPPWRKKMWPYVEQALDRHDWVVRRRVPFRPELREEGQDWPDRAETMIGLRRLDNLQYCIEQVIADGVPGDLLEAGVWRGGAAIFMRAALAALGDQERAVWVADSFEGLPKPDPKHEADRGDKHWTQDALAVSVEQVKRNFSRYGLLDQRVRFLKGWFNETLAAAPIDQLAVLRADGDMYGSTIDILNALYPKLAIGGYAIIDDYGAVPGCKSAVEDYRSEHGITEPIETIDWTGVFWRRQG